MRPVVLAALISLISGCGGRPPSPAVSTPAQDAPLAAGSAPAAHAPVAAAYTGPFAEVINAADRSADDRALDAGRHPGELLAFADVRAGQRVAELFAGGGYTAELLARVVGDSGVVYGQNSKMVLERFAEKPWSARLASPVMRHVVRLDRELDEPLSSEAQSLDRVLMVLVYHDTVWIKTDRAKMLAAIRAALKPGGLFVVLDHSAAEGHGIQDVQTLHRIEERTLRAEVEAAGFSVLRSSDVWRNARDARDWNASPKTAGEQRGTSDRFAIVFQRPET